MADTGSLAEFSAEQEAEVQRRIQEELKAHGIKPQGRMGPDFDREIENFQGTEEEFNKFLQDNNWTVGA